MEGKRRSKRKKEKRWTGNERGKGIICPSQNPISDTGRSNIQPSSVIRDLGVYMDSELTMKEHHAKTTAACFYHIRSNGRSHLRSANACLLSVPRTRTTYGDRSFAVSGSVAWNSLPVALRSSDVTEETFRRHFYLTVLTISYVDSYRDIDSYVTILPSLPT